MRGEAAQPLSSGRPGRAAVTPGPTEPSPGDEARRGATPPRLPAPHPGTRAPAATAARGSASSRCRCRRRSLTVSVRFQGARRSQRSGPGATRPLAPAGNTPLCRQGSAPKTARAGAASTPAPLLHPRAGPRWASPASPAGLHRLQAAGKAGRP